MKKRAKYITLDRCLWVYGFRSSCMFKQKDFYVIIKGTSTLYMPLLQQQKSTKEARAQARSRTFFLSHEEMCYAARSSIFNSIELPMCGTPFTLSSRFTHENLLRILLTTRPG